jgi:hypothetical protein
MLGGMKKNQITSTTLPLAPVLAARMLSNALEGSEAEWAMKLANGRRSTRQSPIPWSETEAGNPVYEFSDVQAFIDRTLAQRAAVASAFPGSLKTKASAMADVEGERPFVRVMWHAGTAQGTFSLSIPVAKALAAKLLEAATAASAKDRELA